MKLITVPDGMRGIDADATITPRAAAALRAADHGFVVRYVRRAMPHAFDLTAGEIGDILSSGLGLMLVQHVSAEPWKPTAALGRSYGQTAAGEADALGIVHGAIVWLDLEGVDRSTPAQTIIDYCNRWSDAVVARRFTPGLYVGDACGLNADSLYHSLRFAHYWRAYNLNDDQVPVVRGVQLRQFRNPGPLENVPFSFDEDVAMADRMGDRATMIVADT